MLNEQLVSYVRTQLTAGVSADAVKQAALSVGWQPADVDAVFAAVEAVRAATTAPAPAPAAPAAMPVVQTPSSAPSTLPEIAALPSSVLPASRHVAPVLFITAFLIVVGGVIAYAYFVIGGGKQYAEATFMSDIFAKSSQINTASYKATFSLAVNPREKDAAVFVPPAEDAVRKTQYANDVQRVSDVSALARALVTKYTPQGYTYTAQGKPVQSVLQPFPTTLSSTVMKGLGYRTGAIPTDPVTGQPYAYSTGEGRSSFSISTRLESTAAVSAIRSSYASSTVTINGQDVTMTDKTTYLYIPSAMPQPFLLQLSDMMRMISPDISVAFSMGATTDFSKGNLADWHFGVTALGNFGDLSYQVDLEALKKDVDYYFRVNKMPSIFSSIANYKGQWIKITPKAASSSASGYDEFSMLASQISSTESSYKERRAESVAALTSLVQLADTDQLFTFKTAPTKEKVGDRSLYRYQLDVRKDAIVPFYKELLANPEKYKALGFLQDQGLLDYLQSKEFDDIFQYVRSNAFVTVWTDMDGFPAQTEYRLRIVPPDTATQLKDKQIDLTLMVTFVDVNKPVKIDVPGGAKPIETVIKEVSANDPLSSARLAGSDAAIQSDLSTIQTQGEIYYGGAGGNSYGTQSWVSGTAALCTRGMFSDNAITKALQGADVANGDNGVACYATGAAYMVGAALSSSGWWCIDSTGQAKREGTTFPVAAPNAAVCP